MSDNFDGMSVAGWIRASVSTLTHWTENLFSLRLAVRINKFEAGQYTYLALPEPGQSVDAATLEAIAQPYSILSAPTGDELEFFMYTRIEGDLSQRMSRLQPGDTVWVKTQAEGSLTLSAASDASSLCLLATGTGVSPFISMLATDEPWQRFEHVVLVYAVRQWKDFCYRDFFAELGQRYSNRFRLIPVISRETAPAEAPHALQGHIPASLQSGELEQKACVVLTPESSQIMLCGNPGMVKDAVAVLQARGFRDNKPAGSGQLSYEAYW